VSDDLKARSAVLLCVCGVVLAVGGASHATLAPTRSDVLRVALKPLNGSGVSGTATLTRIGQKVRVVVTLSRAVPGKLPAHVHIGSCKIQPNLNVLNTLTSVVKGTSVTVLEFTTWKDILARRFSIHVHRPNYDVIACGDVPHGS
jgi:hypothetical protein